MVKEKGISTTVRLRKDIFARIDSFSKDENRSFSNALELLVLRALGKIDQNEKDIKEIKAHLRKLCEEDDKNGK